ncbi:MAG: FAD-dependent oxidoreductase [bacterium]
MSTKIGIYICECGPNIADNINIDEVIERISSSEDYKNKQLIIKPYKLLCSNEGKEYLEKEINDNELTHLVIAACSPRDHETTFINVCKKTKLNPYLYKMVNIREQCAWMIPDKKKATEKAISYIKAAINRVLHQSVLIEKQLDSNPNVLVIGGGITGMETALSLASKQRRVYLVEKNSILGGNAQSFKNLLPRQENNTDLVAKKITAIQENENIEVFTDSKLENAVGFFGNFEVTVKSTKKDQTANEFVVGAIVLATGFALMPTEKLKKHAYGIDDNVYTALEIEQMMKAKGKIVLKSGKEPKSVGLIHCVGREERGYCSRICCNYILKIISYLKDQSDTILIKDFYKDLCLPHKYDQEYFDTMAKKKVDFIRISDITTKKTHITYTEVNGSKKEADLDMIILAPAMVPAEGTEELAELLNVPLHPTKFFQEAHSQLNPIGTSLEGIYIAGGCHGPQGISESVLQAKAVQGKIVTQLIPGEKIIPEVKVSEIIPDFCMGCQTCREVCCYGAITFDPERGICVVNEAICRGCGNCVGSCPSGAIRAKHFTTIQIHQEMKEAIS